MNRISLAMGALLSIFALTVNAMPLSPESVRRLRESGQLAQVVERLNNAYAKGVDAPGSNILPAMRQMQRDDPDEITLRVPVILIDFSDNEADEDEYPVEHYEELLFSLDELDPGSMREWYLINSYDEVDIIGDVIGWYRLPQTYDYYVNGQNGEGEYPRNAQGMVRHAVIEADDDIDFSDYDNDDDGTLDAIFIVHAGPDAADNFGNEDMIWSHAWELEDNRIELDDVWIDGYTTTSEDGPVGVFGHELAHGLFGLPDLYDRDYSSVGLGDWSMMASGSWGDDGRSPTHFDAWSKFRLGFIDPAVLAENLEGVEIPPIEEEDVTYILWTDGDFSNEYFLIENRQRIGFDESLPGGGLLIYHIDEENIDDQNDNEWYPDNQDEGHYLVALEQADGFWDLEQNMDLGDNGDPFPGLRNNSAFTHNTTPNSDAYSSNETNVSVTSIELLDGVVTCDLSIGEGGEPHDSILYDDGNPVFLDTLENYWSKVTFTAEDGFELRDICFMPFNTGPNFDTSCQVRVYREDNNHDLGELLWQTEIEQLEEWDPQDVSSNWHNIALSEDDWILFDQGENFTVVYGPAPGGIWDPDDVQEGDGWWNLTDEETEVERSYLYEGDDPAEEHEDWSLIQSDLLIRVVGNAAVPEPPSSFSLLEPVDGDTLVTAEVTFMWEESIDPNPEDVVSYMVWFQAGNDSDSVESAEPTLTIALDDLGVELLPETVASWWVVASSDEDTIKCNDRFSFVIQSESVRGDVTQPAEFGLYDVYPNPFNGLLRIEYGLEVDVEVSLMAYDLTGRVVGEPVSGLIRRGMHSISWDASALPSGVYLIRLSAGEKRDIRKVLLLR